MAANIFGGRFLGFRKPAWHGLGEVFDEPKKPTEALSIMPGGDAKVETIPVTASVKVGTKSYSVPTGQVAIVRHPTPDDPEARFFGFAGPDYEPLENGDICKILDGLPWPTETMGLLDMGRRFFCSLRVGETQVGGEEVKEFFLVTEGKDGGSAIKIAYTPVRVVCQNTLVLGLAQATFDMAVQHRAGAKAELEFAVKIAEMAKLARQRSLEAMQKMSLTKLVEDQVADILRAAYPEPATPRKVGLYKELVEMQDVDQTTPEMQRLQRTAHNFEVFKAQVATYRDGAQQLYKKINDEYPAVAGTAWAAYNAVVECEDYRNGSDNIDESSLWGPRAETKKRAFSAALAVC